MSWSCMLWAHKLRVGLTPNTKIVLQVLAEHANEDGSEARPSVATIAREGEMCERSVQRALVDLAKRRIIKEQRPPDRSHPTVWRLLVDLTVQAKVRGDILSETGVTSCPERGDILSEKLDKLSPKPVLEPVQEEPVPSTLASLGTRAREEPDEAPVIQPQAQAVPEPSKAPSSPLQAPSKLQVRAPAARGSRCPADWQPGPALIAFGANEGLTEPQVCREADRMRDWSLSAAAGRKLDWDRTFRNWLRRAADGQRPRTVVVEKTVTLAPRPLSGRQQAIANIDAALARVGSQRSFLDLPALGSAD